MAARPPSIGPGSIMPPGDQPSSLGCLFAALVLEFVVSALLALFLWRIHQPWWGGPQDPESVTWLIIVTLGALSVLYGPWLVIAALIRPRLAVLSAGIAATGPLWLVLVGALAER